MKAKRPAPPLSPAEKAEKYAREEADARAEAAKRVCPVCGHVPHGETGCGATSISKMVNETIVCACDGRPKPPAPPLPAVEITLPPGPDEPSDADARLLAGLRRLGVNVSAFLLDALSAERHARHFLKTKGANVRASLPELIRRDCIAAPSVLLELRLLRLLGKDEVALRRAGDALGEPSRLRKRKPRSLTELERIEKAAQEWHAAERAAHEADAANRKGSPATLRTWRDRKAREAGTASGESFLRQLQAARKKAKG